MFFFSVSFTSSKSIILKLKVSNITHKSSVVFQHTNRTTFSHRWTQDLRHRITWPERPAPPGALRYSSANADNIQLITRLRFSPPHERGHYSRRHGSPYSRPPHTSSHRVRRQRVISGRTRPADVKKSSVTINTKTPRDKIFFLIKMGIRHQWSWKYVEAV